MNHKIPFAHGPENAEHELKVAYNCVIESGVTHFWDQNLTPLIRPEEVVTFYKKAMAAYKNNDRLTAERWARAAKHLARAFWHEAKISYFEPRSKELEYLENAAEEYQLHEHGDTTSDLLESVSHQVPTGMAKMPDNMLRYISIGKKHLSTLENRSCTHELSRAEHLKAAHEYGRTVECMLLAFEADFKKAKAA